jgi:hypothetical protein
MSISPDTLMPIIRSLIVLVVAMVQYGCANESIPQGGKQDQEPPTLVKANPPLKSTHFQSNKIQLAFNEFLKTTGFSQTLVSPPLDKRPDFKSAGKTITVKLKSPLRENTTYTINFADDIKDLNEGNTTDNFTYVFSTGDYIDSLKVFGNVFLAKDNSPADGVVVSLYPADSMDAIRTSKPYYFAKTDKLGHFEISNVKAGKYQIYGLKDQNYNYLYDQPNETIAFSDSILQLDTLVNTSISLYLFDDQDEIKLNETRSIAPGLLQISYTGAIQSFKMDGEIVSQTDFASLYDTNDTINYWFSRYYIIMDNG